MLLMTPLANADSAYMLQSGVMRLKIPVEDASELSFEGAGRTLGAIELLIAQRDKIPMTYAFHVTADEGSSVIKVPPDKLMALIHRNPKAAQLICRDIARINAELSNFQSLKMRQLSQDARRHREYCKILVTCIRALQAEYDKRKLPWLEPVIKTFSHTLEFQEGESYAKTDAVPPMNIAMDKLDEFNTHFPPGAYVCKEGEEGEELYVLNQGRLSVEIQGNEINVISNAGTVIGELALLMGITRTASLRAVGDTYLTVIRRTDLAKVAESQPDFWESVGYSMAQRVMHSLNAVKEIEQNIEKNADEIEKPAALNRDSARVLVKDLSTKLKELVERYDMDWLMEIRTELVTQNTKVRNI